MEFTRFVAGISYIWLTEVAAGTLTRNIADDSFGGNSTHEQNTVYHDKYLCMIP